MILFAFALAQAAASPVPTLGAIGKQSLPAAGCAAYLWDKGEAPRLVAMVAGQAGTLRLTVDGKPVVIPRVAARGEARLGLPASADFAGEGLRATLDLTVVQQSDLLDGARVPAGTLHVARDGGDAVVMPVAGLAGCVKGKE